MVETQMRFSANGNQGGKHLTWKSKFCMKQFVVWPKTFFLETRLFVEKSLSFVST